MHRPKTIAWVVKGDEGYGVRAAVLNLAKGVRNAGVRTVFASLEPGTFAEELKGLGYEVAVAACGAPETLQPGIAGRVRVTLANAAAAPRRGQAVATALRQFGPDVVDVVWPNLVSIAGRAAWMLRVPCMWEMPNIISTSLPFGLNSRLYRNVCKRWGVTVLANSDYTGRTYGTGADTPITFYPTTDSDRFDPAKVLGRTRDSVGIAADAVVFTIVARISDSKGQLRFFDGMLRAQDAGGPPLHLLLLGGPTDASEAAAMRTLAKAKQREDRLHFAGVVKDAETYYPMTDVGVNSRVDPEPFGLSVIESMLMGRPVLAHALGGPAETVLDGTTGWLCQGATPAEWEAALRRVLADQGRWPDMGQAAREHALRHFSIESAASKYLEIAERAMSARRSR
ncbi:MAG: glycosyltransferase family 4 protein [Phycisphaerales bacterium]|jgi:hypothetical protein